MNNFKLIYKHIDEKKIKVVQTKGVVIKIQEGLFTSKELKYILSRVKYLKRYSLLKLNVKFDFGKVSFADKTTYIILDMMFYDLIRTTNFDIRINMSIVSSTAHSGLKNTAFIRSLNKETGRLGRELFVREYEKKVVASNSGSYRRYVKREEIESEPSLPSVIVSDISFILKQNFDDEIWVEDVCEAIGEVIDNTTAHTTSDCLIDVDVCSAINNQKDPFEILTIVVANFSEDRIFDRIKNNIISEVYSKEDSLYKTIYEAYNTHKNFFDEYYSEDDFFHITAFQNGVTSRSNISGNSGSGLTTLIKNIVGKSVDNYSYVLSGRNILFFKQEYLKIVDEGYIGFNDERDYFGSRPSYDVVDKSDVFIPGTIFHLLLVRKRNYGE